MDASPTPAEAEEVEAARYTVTPAQVRAMRRAAWEAAPFVSNDEFVARRVGKGDGYEAGEVPQRPRAAWRGTDDFNCRGIASKHRPWESLWKVERVPAFRQGYCRRTACECCAPAPAHGGAQMCSCIAQQDGLCQRCWYDYFCGYRNVPNTFVNKEHQQ